MPGAIWSKRMTWVQGSCFWGSDIEIRWSDDMLLLPNRQTRPGELASFGVCNKGSLVMGIRFWIIGGLSKETHRHLSGRSGSNPFIMFTHDISTECSLWTVGFCLGEINVPRRHASLSDRSVRRGQDCRRFATCSMPDIHLATIRPKHMDLDICYHVELQ
jgi:hypothetical protein